jgi:hypothetical protein
MHFTGVLGEITVDTTNKTLRVHDGVALLVVLILPLLHTYQHSLSSLSANKINQNASNVTVECELCKRSCKWDKRRGI